MRPNFHNRHARHVTRAQLGREAVLGPIGQLQAAQPRLHLPLDLGRVVVQEGEQRINAQSWDELTIEGFPLSAGSAATRRYST